MRLICISWALLFLIESITPLNLKLRKIPYIPADLLNVSGQRIYLNYLTQANANASAVNQGTGNANAVASSVAQTTNNIYSRRVNYDLNDRSQGNN